MTDRMKMYEKMDRIAKRATSYLRSASLWLPESKSMPVQYWTLLDQAVDTAKDIVEHLPDDFFETREIPDLFGLTGGTFKHNVSDASLEKAEALVAAIKARRSRGDRLELIRKLENTTGRTEQEAAMYRDRAAQLRAEIKEA